MHVVHFGSLFGGERLKCVAVTVRWDVGDGRRHDEMSTKRNTKDEIGRMMRIWFIFKGSILKWGYRER